KAKESLDHFRTAAASNISLLPSAYDLIWNISNGSIEDVTIEQTSGNEYYDLAGKRAVLSARLPEFPAEMPEPYLDAHFSFTVGEQSG
ncbi:MAG: hypothetical protein C4293_05870, partial [Nitrospiraceae bacterium]